MRDELYELISAVLLELVNWLFSRNFSHLDVVFLGDETIHHHLLSNVCKCPEICGIDTLCIPDVRHP